MVRGAETTLGQTLGIKVTSGTLAHHLIITCNSILTNQPLNAE